MGRRYPQGSVILPHAFAISFCNPTNTTADSDQALGNYYGIIEPAKDKDEALGNYYGVAKEKNADEALGNYYGIIQPATTDADEALGKLIMINSTGWQKLIMVPY